MNAKLLLIALSALAFNSCSTAYKSGQTPDDVYYSPLKMEDESQNNKREEDKTSSDDRTIRMHSRDRRWREIDNDNDYRNSPYHYCTCKCNSNGYYYNSFYHPTAVYSKTVIPVNTTPRMVNLNAYSGINKSTTVIQKDNNGGGYVQPKEKSYNNSNGKSGVGNLIRQIFSPSASKNSNSSSSNNNRTYSPSENKSEKPSSGSSKSETVTRPVRNN